MLEFTYLLAASQLVDPETVVWFDTILIIIKRILSLVGGLVIMMGALYAIFQFFARFFDPLFKHKAFSLDVIRLNLGRTIVLGLEFIVAADVIETTTAPDYYSVGILAILVFIRTFLSFFLNRELNNLTQLEKDHLA